MPALGIVLPVYNERTRLPHVFEELEPWARRRPDWQFLFVDDGSTDGSAEFIEQAIQQAGLDNLRLHRQPTNTGKGRAIHEGFERLDAPRLAFTDGDLAFSLDHLEQIEAELDHCDVVIGNRNLVAQSERSSLRRKVLGWCFNRLARLILGLPYRDTQAGLKAFRAEAAHALLARQRIFGFGFDAELLFIAKRLGLTTHEIPARVLDDHNYKTGKVKLLKDSLWMLGDLLLIRLNGAQGFYNPTAES